MRHLRARSQQSLRRTKKRRRFQLEVLESRRVLASVPVISEFLASNSDGLRDEDGESSDWIEIYNPSSAPVDLEGWALSDEEGDSNKWVFPAVTIDPNDFLLVFASSKNRMDPLGELHTNFNLSSDGEYLALLMPDGTPTTSFAPAYPAQTTNVSFGFEFLIDTFVGDRSPAKLHVPTDDSLGETWYAEGFDDASFENVDLGIGYGVGTPGFALRYVRAQAGVGFDGTVSNLTEAELVLSVPEYQALSTTETVPVINLLGSGPGGHFGDDLPFPTQSVGDDYNHFAIEATTTISIPSAGAWSFGVNSDDGFGLELMRDGEVYASSFPSPRAANDTIATFDLPAAGDYQARLVMFEATGGASVELFAASGTFQTFSDEFRLVGDIDSGGLEAAIAYIATESDVIETDVQAEIQGVNSGAYLRVPFQVSDVAQVESLLLEIQYDDGFVVYLNGLEVARRNAPENIAFDSAATVSRSLEDVRTSERILLDDNAIASLQDGDNVLAIHGLNDSLDDDRFLIATTLQGIQLLGDSPSHFATPTPLAANVDAVEGFVERVTADMPAGFYDSPLSVSLDSATQDAIIRYTMDGTEPSLTNGFDYSMPLEIDATTNLRVAAFKPGYYSLPSRTWTYLFLDDVLLQSNDGSAPDGFPLTWNTNVVDYGMDPDVIASETAGAVKDALLSLPTWSVTTDVENLFGTTGVYANAQQDGRDWERPVSLEIINADGSDGTQVNAGIRIRGGFSRSDNNPKHALKFFFRSAYGDSQLQYPVHGDAGVSEFKKIDLRTPQNYSWSFDGNASNNFVAEVMARINQRDMGQPSTLSQWVHLYLNGQYWGMYQTQERADANFAASYFGGNASDYDVLKPERGDYRAIATDGNFDAYTDLWNQATARAGDGVTPAFVDNAAYLRAQGLNPDRTENLDYPVLLDVDSLIVYMIGIIRGGNLDAPISNFLGNNRTNNYFAIRDRTSRVGFKFFQHDAEHTLRNVNENRNGPYNHPNFESDVGYFNPQWLHQQLMANEEYRLRFADKVQKEFFNDGTLTTAAQIAKWQAEVAKIEQAVIAESARWGDAKRTIPLGQADFLNAVAQMINDYLPRRTPIVIDQLRNTVLTLKDDQGNYSVNVPAPLFPTISAPQFLINGAFQHGGVIAPQSELAFSAPQGQVYYTTDGSDPREFGGGINPNASVYDPQTTNTTPIAAGAVWRYQDTGVDLGSAWRSEGYDDSAWSTGDAELGYGDGDENTVVSYGSDAGNKFITTYFRKQFEIDFSNGMVTAVSLRLRRDDGAAVYINGTEVVRDNLPGGTLTAGTLASSVVGGASESAFFEYSIDPSLFHDGSNTIAVEVHQISGTSSDISFDAELQISQQDAPPIEIDDSARILTRAFDGVNWSPLEQADFSVPLVPAAAEHLRVTELHYHPAAPPAGLPAPLDDDNSYEFIELRNVSDETISLEGVTFTDGIDFTFDGSRLPWLRSGEIALVVKNIQAFEARYGTGLPIAGEYLNTSLSNGGETITIQDALGQTIQSFTYDDGGDGWHPTTDGDGPSLTILSTNGDYDLGTNWRPSFASDGTPGMEENDPPSDILVTGGSVDENLSGAFALSLTAVDVDDFETAEFELLPGADANAFVLTGNELYVGGNGLDFEAGASRTVNVRVTDSAGAVFDKAIEILINDLNEAPMADAGGPYAAVVGQPLVLAGFGSDVDNGQSLTYEWDLDFDGTFQVDAVGQSPTVTFDGEGTANIALRVTDDGEPVLSAIATSSVSVASPGEVVLAGVAYAGATAAFGPDAVAPDILPLRPGQTAAYENITNYVRGLNRVVIDLAGAANENVSAEDFEFRIGNSDDVDNWTAAPSPIDIRTEASVGTDGATRVTVTWADQAIKNQWLQVTVRATETTRLLNDSVFYFGNQVADTDGAAAGQTLRVTAVDTLRIRANQSALPNSVGITNDFDLDRDGRVTAIDSIHARQNQVLFGGLVMISPPA